MRLTIWILLALVGVAAGLFLWNAGRAPAPVPEAAAPAPAEGAEPAALAPAGNAPRITGIAFPEQMDADGEYVEGSVAFASPGAPLVHVDFAVVEAVFFGPFGFDPGVGDLREGAFPFYISAVLPQEVTLRVTLTDADGRESEPRIFSFAVVGGAMPGGF